MNLPALHCSTICVGLLMFFALGGNTCIATIISYEFSGHIEVVTDNPDGDPLTNLPFQGRMSFSTDTAQYGADMQPGNASWGEYSSSVAGTAIELHFSGLDLGSSEFYTTTHISNDSPLVYDQPGVPHFFGDQFAIWYRVEQTTVFTEPNSGDQFEIVTPYLLMFLATDTTGSAFTDDTLRTDGEFGLFDDFRIRIVPIIPVSGSDPPRLYYRDVYAVVDAISVVPEPSSLVLVFTFGFGLMWPARARFFQHPEQLIQGNGSAR